MKNGLVVGKFYPIHAGHQYLIDTAIQQVEELTIMVIEREGEIPNGKLREKWMKELYPSQKVMLIPDIGHDDDSKIWAKYTIEILGQSPDAVFTSEEYGDTWSKELGCKHILVDINRIKYPVSGTKVRNNPYKYWEFLSKPVRAFYSKRICVIGAESTGTTTLSRALAEHFRTTWVPEYGREYTYGKVTANKNGSKWTSEEFDFIAKIQNMQEDQFARYSNKILICDTNSFATAVWHERYVNKWSKNIERMFRKRKYDLYILTDTDIPFVQDGIRDGESIRKKMHDRFIELLNNYKYPYVIVSGDLNQRVTAASNACGGLFKTKPYIA